MANYFYVIFFSLIGGVFSLLGGLLLLSKKGTAEVLAKYATPFAAGALLAAAFFDLLPEAIEITAEGAAPRWVLTGIVTFFLLEHFLRWFHHHHEHEGTEDTAAAPLIVIGDSIHNLLDGVAIGAAFLINVPTGIVAAFAVAAHEIPQEIGDFGLLLKYGYARKKVILINIVSALMSTVGALLTFWIGAEANLPLGEVLAITAGMFIYIAASDLIPTIHASAKAKASYTAAVLLLMGILVIGFTTEVAHQYIEPADSHNVRSQTQDHYDE
ncbi:ZIP family metal transporter [Candidatus Saccharibacteria bacterium]|nr:ZIP family metal transporter [Candidatus Saccharibacteria bacterium]